jgi:hypothetical protein
MLLMTLLMSYPLSPHLVGPLVDAKTVHQQKKGPNLTRFLSKFTPRGVLCIARDRVTRQYPVAAFIITTALMFPSPQTSSKLAKFVL